MPPSRLDSLYRRLLVTKFFTKGWGTPENLQRLFEFRKIIANREACYKLIPPDYPVEITKEEKQSDCTIIEGKFLTPLEIYLPGLVPTAAQDANFQIVLPNKWKDERYKPMCLHLAGTGDHFYWRRRNFIAKPLLKEHGIGAILLENPFYGMRKPKDQIRSCLHNVSDIFVMGGCLVLESLVLFHWCERNGLGPLGITGLSMGGHMASLAATNWPKPLVLVPCLSWSTASQVFTEGVLSRSINWDRLEMQFFADGNYCERLAKMVTVVDESFLAGQQFIQQFNQSLKSLKYDINEAEHTTDTAKTQVIQINDQKKLSSDLVEQLMSKDATEFTTVEINYINDKIKEIQAKLEEERKEEQRLAAASKIEFSLEAATNAITYATNGITSAIYDGSTKLMSLISPGAKPEEDTTITPSPKPAAEKIDITKTNWWEREALQFMRGVMDECTHLKHFSVPYDTSLIIVVCAKDDAYVPRDGCSSLEDVWPGSEVRYLDAGHVSAYILHQKLFRSCIAEAFERSKKKWEPLERTTFGDSTEITRYRVKDDESTTHSGPSQMTS